MTLAVVDSVLANRDLTARLAAVVATVRPAAGMCACACGRPRGAGRYRYSDHCAVKAQRAATRRYRASKGRAA